MEKKVGFYEKLSSIKKMKDSIESTDSNLAWGGSFIVTGKSLSASSFFDIQSGIISL